MRISKSKFMAGRQCLKRLYWQVHEPELAAEPDAAAEAIIEQGREVGLARPPAVSGWRRGSQRGGLGSGDPRHARANRETETSRRSLKARSSTMVFSCASMFCIVAKTVAGD